MNDILIYETKLAEDYSLTEAIDQLIDYIIQEKKFHFSKEELTFDIGTLETDGVLIATGSHLEVSSSSLFFNQFYLFYSNKFSFILSESVDDIFIFIEKIEEDLKTESYNAGVSSFFKRLKRFLVFLINKNFQSDFTEYIRNLSKARSGIKLYDFNYSYCKVLPYLNVGVETVYENLKHLLYEVTDETVGYNGNVTEIRRALTFYCKSNIDQGLLLWEHVKKQSPIIDNINSAIIQGIYDIKRDLYWEQIESISKITDLRLSVMLSLCGVKAKTDIEARKYFDLINSFDEKTDVELYNFPQFLQNLINNDIVGIGLKKLCFSKFEELIISTDQKLRNAVLYELSYIQNFDDERIGILKKLIETPDFDKQQNNGIANVFITNKSLNGFIELIHQYASRFKLDFNADMFSSAFHNFRSEQPEKLSIELIKLLTHDLGEIRYIGHKILNHLTPHHGRFIFQTNILQLDALVQYKLWMSVLMETKEPYLSLPMLLPLLESSFSFVRESLIGKIEQLSEEYGSSVLNTLETELDLNIDWNKKVCERVKKYNDDFWNEITKKGNIKEFNPLYTQSELYTLHSTNFGKSFNKSLSENVQKESVFMQFATTVILAKSGGWKHEKHSKVEKLGQFSRSFQLPRSYFISPESFDWNFRTHYIENWENILKEWEVIISS